MNALIRSMKDQFAESTAMQNTVGDRCHFVIDLNKVNVFPTVVYNAREISENTKDGFREYDLTVFVLAKNITDLLNVYEVCKTVMDTETTDFVSVFSGSSYPEMLDDHDDTYIVDINYKVEQ